MPSTPPPNGSTPADVPWQATITVPFAPETPASGIGHTAFLSACWYRRTVTLPAIDDGEHLVLHFGAVDYDATVWVDGQRGPPRGRLHAVLDRHHASCGRRAPSTSSSACRRRSARPGETARQTGLAARAALDLVSAHDRHLADRLARGACRRSWIDSLRWTPEPRALGDRPARRGSPARAAMACGCTCN